jgi:hypothetical protein
LRPCARTGSGGRRCRWLTGHSARPPRTSGGSAPPRSARASAATSRCSPWPRPTRRWQDHPAANLAHSWPTRGAVVLVSSDLRHP